MIPSGMRVSQQKQSFSISQTLATTLSFGLFIYFAYPLLHGDNGYFALRGLQQKLVDSEANYNKTQSERLALENKVKMLRPQSIELDLLDERARVVLGFMKPTEKAIIDKDSGK